VRNIIKRSITGAGLVILVVSSTLGGPYPFFLLILLVYSLGTWELLAMNKQGPGFFPVMLALSGAAMIGLTFLWIKYQFNPLWLALPSLVWLSTLLNPATRNSALLLLFWITLPLASLLALGWFSGKETYSALLPLSLIAIIWINDTFAYLAGSLLGRHQMTPKLSPRKTWEGFAGGFIFSVLSAYLICLFTGSFSLSIWLLTGAICSLLGLSGDLFESHIKRRRGLKDSGRLLPGHGGILDRFDSLLFVAPLVLLVLLLENLLR